MNFIKIAWRDISGIFKNRFLRISVTAIIVVPLLYSLLYLAAFWDPYSKLSSMPVAVVNLDKGAVKDGENVSYGEDIVGKLKGNDKIGWKFVSWDEANQGVKGKKYYAMFVIPEDFSKNVISAKDGKPVQPKILYSANEKRNFLAAQINGKVELELKSEITKNISENYTKVAFDKLYEIKDGMNKASDGSKELAEGMKKLNDNVPEMTNGISKLYDGSEKLKDGMGVFKTKVDQGSNLLTGNEDILSLLNYNNINSLKSVMSQGKALINSDTSMLTLVPYLVNDKNIALMNKTTEDMKNINVDKILDKQMINQASSIMEKDNKEKLIKLAKDADSLTQFEIQRFKPLMTLAGAPADNLISLINNANSLYNGIDKQKVQPLLGIASKSGEIASLMDDVEKLSKSLDKEKLNPIFNMMANKDKVIKLIDDAQSLYASLDKEQLKPLVALTSEQNMGKISKVMLDAKGLSGINIDDMVGKLDSQQKGAEEFIKQSAILNGGSNVASLKLAINTNPNISEDQKKQLSVLVDGYNKLTTETAENMKNSAGFMGETNKTLSQLKTMQSDLNEALPLMSGALQSAKYVQGVLPEAKKLYGTYEKDVAPLMIGMPQSLKYVESMEPAIQGVYGKYTAIAPYMNGVADSAKYVSTIMPKAQQLAKQVDDNKNSINTIKSVLTPENIMYLKGFENNVITVKNDLDANSQNIDNIKSILTKLGTNVDDKTIIKLKSVQEDIEKAKPIIKQLESNITPQNMKALERSPELVNNLLSIQKQLKNNEKLMQVAEDALKDNNIEMAKKLLDAVPMLTDGVNRLAEGSSQLNDGLKLLNSKIPELADGSGKLADGSKELSDKLKEGADKLNSNLVNDSDTMSKFVSESVIMDEKPINPVKDYGTGFAPYFIPLSLWVGAIMMFFVISDKVDNDIKAGSGSIVLGKFLSYGYIGILQSVLASFVVLALGLKPANIPLYILFNVFMSFVFIAIIQSLIFLLGEAGRLLAIVLLILQLTSCAGTFPLEVVPRFFKVLNPYMPFTYCVSALREVISGVDYAIFGKDVAILAAILVVFLTISVLMKGHADKVQMRLKERKGSITA